jgi:hypothetical protein
VSNKIDDPDDEEQAELVAEAETEVEKIFDAPFRYGTLQELLRTQALPADAFPVFLPIVRPTLLSIDAPRSWG